MAIVVHRGVTGAANAVIGLFRHISSDCILDQEKSVGLRLQNFQLPSVGCVEKLGIACDASAILTES
jgi:hypothetical protein